MHAGGRGVGRYLVEDPYGEEALSPAVRAFFGLPDWAGALTCGAGVISLLHGLAGLSAGGTACVIGDSYPDFPHWVQTWGGTCLGRSASGLADRGEDPLGDVRAGLIFLERPSLFGTALDDLVTIRWLCERAADRDAVVVVDESNANYRPPAYSAVPLTGEVPNLVVARGFSKAYGMGGLRLGYCASSPELRSRLRCLIPPLLASSLSLRIGAAILRAGDVAEPLRARIATAKRLLVRFLATAGFTDVLPAGDDLPYVFLAGAIGPIHARLLQRGVIGKPHGSWSWASETSSFSTGSPRRCGTTGSTSCVGRSRRGPIVSANLRTRTVMESRAGPGHPDQPCSSARLQRWHRQGGLRRADRRDDRHRATVALPVPRSCHVGNNGAYNWGWLALARNSRVLLYDHTSYGADRVCLPWAVLDDDGLAAAVYDVDGGELAALRGSHAGAVAAASPARYRSILNYGVPATHDGLPLAAHHFLTNSRLAAHFNGSEATFDAREALDAFSVVESIVSHALPDGRLPMLFDRWVERRRGRVVFTKVAAMDVEGERASMLDPQGGTSSREARRSCSRGAGVARDGGRSHLAGPAAWTGLVSLVLAALRVSPHRLRRASGGKGRRGRPTTRGVSRARTTWRPMASPRPLTAWPHGLARPGSFHGRSSSS